MRSTRMHLKNLKYKQHRTVKRNQPHLLWNLFRVNDMMVRSLKLVGLHINIAKFLCSFSAPSSILEVNDEPWTNEEQQLLEGAMKTYPSSYGVERWNLIAECIPNRSRADCIKRYKYLVQLVKAKNAAKQKAAKK